MRKLSRRLVIITAIVGALIAFGYFQYASALQLHVSIKDSKLVERTQDGSLYRLQLEIKNPSLMVLNIGKTDFLITVDGEDLGTGILEPSLVPALGKTIAEAPFLADNQVLDKYDKSDVTPPVKLTGITRYNLVFTSLDIPFTYYPTQKEAREFIHGQ
ncbi:MAG: hypothetical protein HY295_07350 [Thaumarchaeota archaeon]|nr:hypothetical protein [Nitrososphaerota archaeon]